MEFTYLFSFDLTGGLIQYDRCKGLHDTPRIRDILRLVDEQSKTVNLDSFCVSAWGRIVAAVFFARVKHHKQNTSRQQHWLRLITATPTRLVEKTSQLVLHVSLPLLQILLLCSAQLEQKSQLVSIKKKKSKVIILHSRVDELRFSPHQQVLLVDESEPVHQQVLLILIWNHHQICSFYSCEQLLCTLTERAVVGQSYHWGCPSASFPAPPPSAPIHPAASPAHSSPRGCPPLG